MIIGGFLSLLLSILVLVLVVALPLKVGAHFAAAKRTGVFWCLLAAFVGVFVGNLAAYWFGNAIGAPLAAALGFVIAIRFMLGTTFAGAIGLTIIAVGVFVLGVVVLSHFGMVQQAGSQLTYT
ncbi:MAG TPA: hypothetical protein VMI92_07855 [Steroidobacteraceae bacterium]|nr:hypothetical protein [Steroidobacteraceae bacterium]